MAIQASLSSFGDLRKLADWFGTSPPRSSLHVERIVRRLGVTSVPLLGRELRDADPRRREAARDYLAMIAATDDLARTRVIEELRRVLDATPHDELKVCALGLLSELGERGAATFSDPSAMQRRSALALAAQLDSDADIATAADMMIRQLDSDDITQMVEALADASPAAALRLASELGARLDVEVDVREHVVAIVSMLPVPAPTTARRPPRPTQVAVLVDASGRSVVVASRKISGERRWRRWAVLIGGTGDIEDCLHEEVSARPGEEADAAPLIATLCADGYRVASGDVDHARTVVTAAARIAAARTTGLSSAYYLGRDLLDLGDAHLPSRSAGARRAPSEIALSRAVELVADGDHREAAKLLDGCDRDNPDVCAALAACALADRRWVDAGDLLGRAIAAEPAWPLHHWNLAVAHHALGEHAGCYHALRRFLTTSARPTALHGDPDQPARVASAERLLGDLERAARLTGRSLARARKRRKL